MKNNNKTYWKGTEQLTNDPEFVKNADREFPEYLPINETKANGGEGASRRDFLKMMGFGIAAASLAACEAPVRKAIPYLNKPVDVDPGIPNYYASTYANGGDYCSIVVKTREGRPIKIEGNKLSGITHGGTSAQVEASVLSLYDKERLEGPKKNGEDEQWFNIDAEITKSLNELSATGEEVYVISNTILSPSTKAVLADFQARYTNVKWISYDQVSAYGILKANEASFGQAILPSYDFSKADTIVSFGADFLGTWISPVEFTRQYSKTRKVNADKRHMSRHYQFESTMSLTGANADYRVAIKPSQEGAAVAALYNAIAAKAGAGSVNTAKTDIPHITKAANDLWKSRGKSLVVSGSNDKDVQTLINAINDLLGNYGKTIDLNTPAYYRQGDDQAMNAFVAALKSGTAKGAIFFNCNPVYDHPKGAEIAAGIAKLKLSVSTSDRMDETTALVTYVTPDHHYLESWNDAEPKQGHFSLQQPAISPLFKTRQAQESLLTWAGAKDKDFFSYIQAYWTKNIYQNQSPTFDIFWDQSLHDGVVSLKTEAATTVSFAGDINASASAIAKNYRSGDGLELVLYQKVGIGSGNQANNPWLQEMPDPVTKATWDNYLTVSQKHANELGIKMNEGETSRVELKVGERTLDVPVLIQPGQAEGTVGLAIGYGRTKAGKVANGVGINAYPLIGMLNGACCTSVTNNVSIVGISGKYNIARTQTHQTFMGREAVVQETVLADYKNPDWKRDYNPKIALADGSKVKPAAMSLWKGHKYENHHWGLAIDLNSCTGCSACTIACQAENNVSVVGKQEVLNRRDMHWIRIDRYYSSDAEVSDLRGLEKAAENPEVTFQPMMCQHCNNAPCETVCPVAATTHSTEGLNQMTYNRCIGTRYCANNCPYKVRRFNWFKYHDNEKFPSNTAQNNNLGKMVLNPDVTVRSRGVMEKCSMCVQRIQAGKLQAKKERRPLEDKDINTACASACPSDAIVFGDLNNTESSISKFLKIKEYQNEPIKEIGEERAYHVLEELRVAPNVWYMTKVRNKDKEENNA